MILAPHRESKNGQWKSERERIVIKNTQNVPLRMKRQTSTIECPALIINAFILLEFYHVNDFLIFFSFALAHFITKKYNSSFTTRTATNIDDDDDVDNDEVFEILWRSAPRKT